MRKIVDYVTVVEFSITAFDRAVQTGIKEGWEVYGERQTVLSPTASCCHYQTMVRYDSGITNVGFSGRAIKLDES